ncbi:MAG: hypothetical protein ACRDH9_13090 [Actinomycetota bacterium]
MSTRPDTGEPSALLDELSRRLNEAVGELRDYLGSPEGRELRKRIAQVAIIAAPLLFRMKFFRASPFGRVLGLVGGAAIVVKLAEALRDWDPVVDLEPV